LSTTFSGPLYRSQDRPIDCFDEGSIVKHYSKHILEKNNLYELISDNITITYISREDRRRILNEQKLINELQNNYPELEIKMVQFSNMSIFKQMETIRNTTILVGMHGAGLLNLMFLNRESIVVELFGYKMENYLYRNLSKQLGLTYFSWRNEIEKNAIPGTILGYHNADTIVDEVQFLALMKMAINFAYNIYNRHAYFKV